MNLPNLPPVIYLSVVVSLTVAVLLVLTKGLHGRFSMDGLEGIQKMHKKPTPRVGGVAIFAGVIAGWFAAPAGVDRILGVLIVAGLPAFLFGLAEDLTKKVSVLARLLATMASGAFGWWMTGYSLTNVGVPNVLVAVWAANDVRLAALGCLLFSLGYVTIYARLVRFRWCSPLNFLLIKPSLKII